MSKINALVTMMAVCVLAGIAPGLVVTETFDDGDPNWAGFSNIQIKSGGVTGNYLYADRAAPSTPIFRCHGASSGGRFTWSIDEDYGEGGAFDGLEISFFAKAVEDQRSDGAPIELYLYQAGELGAWRYVFDEPGYSLEWTKHSVTVGFAWTDTKAGEEGWEHFDWGGGSTSFEDTLIDCPQVRITQQNIPAGGWGLQQIGIDDFTMASANLGAVLIGDANLDGVVNDADLSLLLANWGQDATGDPDGGWGRGEFNDPPAAPVDDSDLSLLLANWTGARAAVPEPATLSMLALGGLLAARRRR